MVDQPGWDSTAVQKCDWVPGCFYLVRHEVIRHVGLFDPRFFLYYEEVDHCRAVKAAGWAVMYCPDVNVVHLGGESAKCEAVITPGGRQIYELQIESELLYFRKHHGPAGAWSAMLLQSLSETLLALKGVLRRGSFRGAADCWSRLAVSWSRFRRTEFGTRATR